MSEENGKKGLTLLLGSGFSEAMSLPSTQKLTEIVRSMREPTLYGMTDGPGLSGGVSVPGGIWRMATSYYSKPNFETMLHLVETAIAYIWVKGWLAADDRQKSAFGAFMNVMPHWQTFIEQGATFSFVNFYTAALDAIAAAITSATESNMDQIQAAYEPFFGVLGSNFNLTIATLNYDDLVERTIKVWHDGFEPQPKQGTHIFTPSSIVRGDDRPLLLHLHGSTRYYLDPSDPYDMYRADTPNLVHPQTRTPSTRSAQSGETMLVGPMISGLRKADKVSTSPFGYYQHRFQDALIKSPRLLVIGYGGNDPYINSLILEMRKIHGEQFRAVFVTKTEAPKVRVDLALQVAALALGVDNSTADEFDAAANKSVEDGELMTWRNALLYVRGFPMSEAHTNACVQFLNQ